MAKHSTSYIRRHTHHGTAARAEKLAEDIGLICFSSPFDKTAVDFLEEMNFLLIKLHLLR